MADIFEGAVLIAAQVEDGLIKTVQKLSDGRRAVGSFYVNRDGERKPKGCTLMSETTFQALTKQAGAGKAVEFPEVAAKPKAVTKADLTNALSEAMALIEKLQQAKAS